MIGRVTTVVAFHAHPDDEVLLTGGTLAKLAAEGHRVAIVVATDGSMGQASDRRLAELRASADTLGAARVAHPGMPTAGTGRSCFRTRLVGRDSRAQTWTKPPPGSP
jgi:LmbE family N-acetylglucosaminyl deacetylase